MKMLLTIKLLAAMTVTVTVTAAAAAQKKEYVYTEAAELTLEGNKIHTGRTQEVQGRVFHHSGRMPGKSRRLSRRRASGQLRIYPPVQVS